LFNTFKYAEYPAYFIPSENQNLCPENLPAYLFFGTFSSQSNQHQLVLTAAFLTNNTLVVVAQVTVCFLGLRRTWWCTLRRGFTIRL